MINFVFLDFLYKILTDNGEAAATKLGVPYVELKYSLKNMAFVLRDQKAVITGGPFFLELTGDQLGLILNDLIKNSAGKFVLPHGLIEFYLATVSRNLTLEETKNMYQAWEKAALNMIEVSKKYPNDTYFVPTCIAGRGFTQQELAAEVRSFIKVVREFAYVLKAEAACTVVRDYAVFTPSSGSFTDQLYKALFKQRDWVSVVSIEAMSGSLSFGSSLGDYIAANPHKRLVTAKSTLPDIILKVKTWEEGNSARKVKALKLGSYDRKLVATSEDGVYKLYDLLSLKALQAETECLEHCVGRSDTYWRRIQSGELSILSFAYRDTSLATLEYLSIPQYLSQCKGFKNSSLSREHYPALIELIKKAGLYVKKVTERLVPEEYTLELQTFVGPIPVLGIPEHNILSGGWLPAGVYPMRRSPFGVGPQHLQEEVPVDEMECSIRLTDIRLIRDCTVRFQNSFGVAHHGVTVTNFSYASDVHNEIYISTYYTLEITLLVVPSIYREFSGREMSEDGGRPILEMLARRLGIQEGVLANNLVSVTCRQGTPMYRMG